MSSLSKLAAKEDIERRTEHRASPMTDMSNNLADRRVKSMGAQNSMVEELQAKVG